MKRVMVILVMGLVFSSCSIIRNTNRLSQVDRKEDTLQVQAEPLNVAQSYVKLAEKAEQIGDTLGAEYYFSKAMDITGEFQEQHSQPYDSLTQSQIQDISLAYAKYLARLNGIEHDTLSAANVMKVLSQMADSVEAETSDSTLVKIPDIIEEEKEMTIPLVLNQKVERAIQYFQGQGRRVFTKWLQRTGRYRELITGILKEQGVPEELFYLAMIESGFNPYARSYARAVGIWQFIYSTGRAYGLHRSWWYDERRDPVKSTRAAAQHLKDLFDRFNNWYLAIAGYNYSPSKIAYRIRRYQVDEFWELPRLPRQTRNYVPTFIATVLIAQEPEKYGFYVKPESSVEFDTVTVRETVDLNVVADCVGSSFQEIKKLNPAILRWCTPPDRDKWVLNIPKGTRQQFLENYANVPDDKKLTWIRHRIRSGETLSTIARRYGVSMWEIKRFNNIRGTLIRAGHSLVIPVPQNKRYAAQLRRQAARSRYSARRKPVSNVPGRDKLVHVVSTGESFWSIAQKYGVSVNQLRRWNGFKSYSRLIRPGDKLNIWLPEDSPFLAARTGAGPATSLPKDYDPHETGQTRTIIYTVKSGDTLWDIASDFGVSIREIKQWNNRRSNFLRPGDRLKIRVSD